MPGGERRHQSAEKTVSCANRAYGLDGQRLCAESLFGGHQQCTLFAERERDSFNASIFYKLSARGDARVISIE